MDSKAVEEYVGTADQYIKVLEAEVARLRARVAELEREAEDAALQRVLDAADQEWLDRQ